jgi:hypothetical protein
MQETPPLTSETLRISSSGSTIYTHETGQRIGSWGIGKKEDPKLAGISKGEIQDSSWERSLRVLRELWFLSDNYTPLTKSSDWAWWLSPCQVLRHEWTEPTALCPKGPAKWSL